MELKTSFSTFLAFKFFSKSSSNTQQLYYLLSLNGLFLQQKLVLELN